MPGLRRHVANSVLGLAEELTLELLRHFYQPVKFIQ